MPRLGTETFLPWKPPRAFPCFSARGSEGPLELQRDVEQDAVQEEAAVGGPPGFPQQLRWKGCKGNWRTSSPARTLSSNPSTLDSHPWKRRGRLQQQDGARAFSIGGGLHHHRGYRTFYRTLAHPLRGPGGLRPPPRALRESSIPSPQPLCGRRRD